MKQILEPRCHFRKDLYFQNLSPRGVLQKTVFLKISQNSKQKTPVLESTACNFI